MSEPRDISVLIAGVGSIGQRHLRNLQALGVGDIRLYRTGRAVRAVPEAADLRVYSDLSTALAERPDAVIVSNPTALHMPVALAAAEAGAHLLIEKPIADSLAGVAELTRRAEERGLRVLSGFQFRRHPALRAVAQWLASERIGRVISAHAHWGEYLPGWHPGEDYRQSYAARPDLGGGVLLTLCHPLDYLRWLIGEVVAVQARLARRSSLGVAAEDTAQLSLRCADGALATVYVDYVQRPPRHELEIIGEAGTIHWSQADHAAVLHDGATGREERYDPPAEFERNTLFVDEMRHFLDCVAAGRAPDCSLADGVAALRIALAAKRASAERREVEIDEIV
ncbi:MAG: gfo/Idh/MocA family oxidoreductase [Candidatus Eisenbacteria bacterium]|nr:gfo/Idh/MocA family oxidoreductase [Candidatus Eisenbacteria bacterium]